MDNDTPDINDVRVAEEQTFLRNMQTRFPEADPQPDCIPQDLFSSRAWLCWCAKPDDKDQTRILKPSVDPRLESPRFAKWSDPSVRATGPDALAFYNAHAGEVHYAYGVPYTVMGLSVVLSPELGITGVDIDHCLQDGVPVPAVAPFLTRMIEAGMYVEMSPSGTGVRAFSKIRLPPVYGGRCIKRADALGPGIGVEVYDAERILTVTGHTWVGTSTDLREDAEAVSGILADLHRIAVPPKPAPAPASAPKTRPLDVSDQELLQRAFSGKQGPTIHALYTSPPEEKNASSGDMRLANLLAWWTGDDPDRLDRLMRGSARLQDAARLAKWDSVRVHGETYGHATCVKACKSLVDWYGKDNGWRSEKPKPVPVPAPKPAPKPVPVPAPVPAPELTPEPVPESVPVPAPKPAPESVPDVLDDEELEPDAAEPPTGVFPKELEAAIDNVAQLYCGGQRGYAFAACLAVLAHGVSGRRAAEFVDNAPMAANLYLLLVGASSGGKSKAFETFFKVFTDIDTKAEMEHAVAMRAYEAEMEAYRHRGKDAGTPPQKPVSPCSELYRDMTDSAIYDAFAENVRPDGTSFVTLAGDEADQIFKRLDAYKQGKAQGSFTSTLIELWNGTRMKKRRTTSTNAFAAHAYLNISGNTQPVMLTKMFSREDFLRGFIGRFVFIRAERPNAPRTFPRGLKLHAETWGTITRLTYFLRSLEPQDPNARKNLPTTQILPVDEDALDLFEVWYNGMARDMWLEGEDRDIIVDKLSMNVSKIAVLLWAADAAFGSEATSITADVVHRAITIGDYLRDCERWIWDFLQDGRRIRQLAHPASVALAEAILRHANRFMEPQPVFVSNQELQAWTAETEYPLTPYSLRSRIRPLHLPVAGHAPRGRLIGTKDIDRLRDYVAMSKKANVTTKPKTPAAEMKSSTAPRRCRRG